MGWAALRWVSSGYRCGLGNVLREPMMESWNSRRYRDLRKSIRSERLARYARCRKA